MSGRRRPGRLQVAFLSLVLLVASLFVINLEVLRGSLRERRIRWGARDMSSDDARALAEVGALSGGEAVRRLRAEVDAQAFAISNLTRSLDDIVAVQRALALQMDAMRGSGVPAVHAADATPAALPLAGSTQPEPAAAQAASAGAEPSTAEAADRAAPGTRAVVIFAYNRPEYLERAMRSVLSHLPTDGSHTLVVSQDGADAAVAGVVQRVGGASAVHLRHTRTELSLPANQKRFAGYYYLSAHYKWALGQLFDVRGYESVIILEDDIEIAPDFFDYFRALAPLLELDPTVLTISAFNDNGQPGLVHDPAAVYRSDFFPGLGWLMTRRLWAELGPKWPLAFWDDWLREPANRRGRASIRPEVSRTYTYGVKGVSSGQFSAFLKNMQLAQGGADWSQLDVRSLVKPAYDERFRARLGAATESGVDELPAAGAAAQPDAACTERRVPYSSHKEFERIAKGLGLMSELKAGVPRTGYQGVVSFRRAGCLVHVAPAYEIDAETHSIVLKDGKG